MPRVMAPDGTLGDIPAENVAAAIAAGGRLMTPDDLRDMYNRLHVQHTLFQQQERALRDKFKPRRARSLRWQRRHR